MMRLVLAAMLLWSASPLRVQIGRRSVLFGAALLPNIASAIDVSGLQQQGGETAISAQLRERGIVYAEDGTAASRLARIREESAAARTMNLNPPPPPENLSAPENLSVAQFAQKLYVNNPPSLKAVLPFKTSYVLTDELLPPPASPKRSVQTTFTFPTDWLRIDAFNGGIQFVDQRNGDKLYLLRAALPAGESLASVGKSWFSEVLFSVEGALSKGLTIESPKTLSAKMSSETELETPRRRALVKYSTVTANGFSVERRGIVDAYEVEGVTYILLVGQNAVLYKQDGRERATAESIADSFRIQ